MPNERPAQERENDRAYMHRALDLARRGWGQTAPNPMVGAVVVSADGTSVGGIVSERDIVRAFAKRGAAVMSEPVTDIYTADVHTITPDISLDEVLRMMTERRIRHAPVVVDGTLRGIVSIGDVVKNRIDELETERAHLTDYITGIR